MKSEKASISAKALFAVVMLVVVLAFAGTAVACSSGESSDDSTTLNVSDTPGNEPEDPDSDSNDTQGTDTYTVDNDATDTDAVDNDATDTEDTEADDTDSQATTSEGTDTEGTDAESTDTQSNGAGSNDVQPLSSKSTGSQATSSEGTDTEGTDTEGTDTGNNATDATDTEGTDTDTEGTDEGTDEGNDTEGTNTDTDATDNEDTEADDTDSQATTSDGQTVATVHDEEAILNPAYWASTYPDEYNSWVEASKATYSVGTAEERNDEHGKINSFLDMFNMMGYNTMTGCIGCHSTAMPALVENYGDDLVDTVNNDVSEVLRYAESVTVGISCYSCHGNTPGTAVVTKTWITEAAEEGGIETDDWNLICAQCHATPDWNEINTNSDSSTWSMLQYGLEPDDYWEVYQNCSEDMFETALGAIPGESEFNQYMNSTMDMAGANCADCHMVNATNSEGNEYKDHTFQSVLTNEDLYENCLSCHDGTVDDRKAAIADMEADYTARLQTATDAVNALGEALDKATEAGNVSEDVLAEAQTTYNKAQFYLAYGTDKGNGIHVMGDSAAANCLEDAVDIAEEGQALLS